MSGDDREALQGLLADEALCLELTGYMPRIIELVGGDCAEMRHPRCRARGFDRCHFDSSSHN